MAIRLSQTAKGISSIIGSCLIYLVTGSTFIWGNISLYATSHFKSVSHDMASIIFPIALLFSTLGIFLSFLSVHYLGFRANLYGSILPLFGFIFACSFCSNFWTFFACFGIGFGICTGFLYLTLLYNTYKYFPSKRGLIGGICMGIYGLSSLISNYILLLLVNPDDVVAQKNPKTGDYYFPDEIANRLLPAFRYLSFYFLGMLIVGSLLQFEFQDPLEESEILGNDVVVEVAVEEFLLKSEELKTDIIPNSMKEIELFKDDQEKHQDITIARTMPPQSKLAPYEIMDKANHESGEEGAKIKYSIDSKREERPEWSQASMDSKRKERLEWSQASINPNDERKCFSIWDAMLSKVFYVLPIMIFMSTCNGYFMATNFKSYGIIKIPDDQFLTLVGSLGAVFNGGGRFFWGLMSDKVGFKRTYISNLIFQIILIATIRFISGYEVPYLIWTCASLLCEGSNFVLFPPICLQVFGPNVGSRVYSVLMLMTAFSNLTQVGLTLALRQKLGFENEMYIFLGMTVVSLVLCLNTEMRYRRRF